MKSVAELIANKDALLKRDKHGKITAASLTAAGAAVLAAAQAEAQSIDGFEDCIISLLRNDFKIVHSIKFSFKL